MSDFTLGKMLSLDSVKVQAVIKCQLAEREREKRNAKQRREEFLPSAMDRSSLVVVRSADTVMLVCLVSAIANSRLARALGWDLALSPYDTEDLLVMPLDMRCSISYQGLKLWCVKRSWPGKTLVSFGQLATFWTRGKSGGLGVLGDVLSHNFRENLQPLLPSTRSSLS